MTAYSEELKELLVRTDPEFRQLSTKHSELESRLHELHAKPYLSEPEHLEEVTLKKKKLALKDQMEAILRRNRKDSPPLGSVPQPSAH
jgi:hypothetical protein